MKKINGKLLFIIMYAIITMCLLVGYFLKSDTLLSEEENRYLECKPTISPVSLADGSYMERFDSYAEDQLLFRKQFVLGKAVCEGILQKIENNGIIKGDDGYLFEKNICIGTGLKRNENAIIQFVNNQNRPVNILIAPNSFEILQDKMPNASVNISESEYISDFYSRLANVGETNNQANPIDVTKMLKSKSEEYIYYKTDHHWTTLGAYYSYLEICEAMKLSPIDYSEIEELKCEVQNFLGTFNAKYKGISQPSDILAYYDFDIKSISCDGEMFDCLYDYSKLNSYDKYGMFLHGNYGMSKIFTNNDSGKKLIVFKDSYANSVIPFLTNNFSEIIIIDLRYFGESVKELLENNSEAEILILYNFANFSEDNHLYRLTS